MNLMRGKALQVAGLMLVLLAAWLFARPYVGLRHDGVPYLAQTLSHIHPGVFAQDFYLAFGSQDRYTVATRLLATLYERTDLATAQLGLVAVTQILLLAGAWRLLKTLAPLHRFMGVLALVLMVREYGGYSMFAFGERFITARCLAEPLAVWATVALLERRWILFGALAALASLVHPLVSLPVLALAWVVGVQLDRRWWWLLALAPLPLVLAFVGVPPFHGLLQRYDPEWWAIVTSSNIVLMGDWLHTDWARCAVALSVLIGVALVDPVSELARLYRAAAWIAVGGVCLSFFAADVFQNVLLTQIQPWRTLWVAQLLSCIAAPALIIRFWNGPNTHRALALAIAAAWVGANGRLPTTWFLLLWALALGFALWRKPATVSAHGGPLLWVSGALLVLISADSAMGVEQSLVGQAGMTARERWALVTATAPLPMFALGAVAWWAANHRNEVLRWVAMGGAMAAVLALSTTWDRRSAWIRHLEGSLHRGHPWRELIPANAQVLWPDQPAAVWLLLHRPSYYSHIQGVGVLFNRGNAVVYSQRKKQLMEMQAQAELCALTAGLGIQESSATETCFPSDAVAASLCRKAPELEYLVLERRLNRAWVSSWSPNPSSGLGPVYHLHRCDEIRGRN